MSDTLRDQIAAVLIEHWPDEWRGTVVQLLQANTQADAVIAALGMQTDEEMDVAPDGQPRFYRRYVTDWETA